MAQLAKGEYRAADELLVEGQYRNLLLDQSGNLRVKSSSSFRESNQFVAGGTSTTGKIGTVAAGATIYVVADCNDFATEKVDWAVSFNKSWTYQFARANSNPLGATITLTDTTAVDDGDTFVLNGLTFTAETTEGDAVASARKYYAPDQPTAATNLAALLTNATYGVPGISCVVTAPTGTDLITIAATSATVLQFGQGTSASNEIAWAETTKLALDFQGGAVSGNADNSTWHAATIPDHYIDGWGWACIAITNNDGSNAGTLEVRATRY